jgi:hypothetical protein
MAKSPSGAFFGEVKRKNPVIFAWGHSLKAGGNDAGAFKQGPNRAI